LYETYKTNQAFVWQKKKLADAIAEAVAEGIKEAFKEMEYPFAERD